VVVCGGESLARAAVENLKSAAFVEGYWILGWAAFGAALGLRAARRRAPFRQDRVLATMLEKADKCLSGQKRGWESKAQNQGYRDG
jgi:hypothetical protein